jgi:hypothetical protein
VSADPGLERVGYLAGGGELGALIRTFDWSSTPMGPNEEWPESLRTATRIMLASASRSGSAGATADARTADADRLGGDLGRDLGIAILLGLAIEGYPRVQKHRGRELLRGELR